jgi:hypothetical protein
VLSSGPADERALVPAPILRSAAALVVGASLVAGVKADLADTVIAFRDAGPSVFHPSVSRQIDEIRQEVPAGETILLVSASRTDGSWYTRLFQRALYPRNDVIVRYLPFTSAEAERVRRAWPIRYGIVFDVAPSSLDLLDRRDLGALPAMPDHVFFGKLAP